MIRFILVALALALASPAAMAQCVYSANTPTRSDGTNKFIS